MHQQGEYDDVHEFHKKFNQLAPDAVTHLTQRKLSERIKFLQEELDEFTKHAADQNMPEMLDALLDLVYVAKGTAVMMGLGEAWALGWDEVQRANMAKALGMTKRGNLMDVTKPPGWDPPDHDWVLSQCNYQPMKFVTNSLVDDGKCLDDEIHQGAKL